MYSEIGIAGPDPTLATPGLRINNAARLFAESRVPRLTLQEHQCRVHVCALHLPWPTESADLEEKDPQTQQVVAIKNYISTYEQTRTIWMDGRPHPSEYAAHTFMGFSTGRWGGQPWRHHDTSETGLAEAKRGTRKGQATMLERFIRHDKITDTRGHFRTPVSHRADDPDHRLLHCHPEPAWTWPCDNVEEITGRPKCERIPHYPPGENPFLRNSSTAPRRPPWRRKGRTRRSTLSTRNN